MKLSLLLLCLASLSAACSPATSSTDAPATTQAAAQHHNGKKGKKGKKKPGRDDQDLPSGLRPVGTLPGSVRESSGFCAAPQAGSYFTFGDDGTTPTIFRVDAAGHELAQFTLGAPNRDWESMSHDASGNYYLGDCGNNNNDRRDLAILRFRPDNPTQVARINFKYPDQTEFPPQKKARNFDCEASLWHDGQVYLFTKDRGAEATCKVYAVPETPGTYTARLVEKIAIPGEVTDAALSPDGRQLVLLAREELFVLEGDSWEAILHATPRRIGLEGAGQTEGAAFKEANTLLITTEQGAIYELAL